MGNCIITENEIIAERNRLGGSRQAFLQILQSKGAPVNGVIVHELNVQYDWTFDRDLLSGKYYISWKKSEVKNEEAKSTFLTRIKRKLQFKH